MPMFSSSNSILLGCMRTRSLMNNFIFETKTRYILFYILQGIVSTKHTNRSRKLIFISLKKDSITLDIFGLSFRRYNQVIREKSSAKSRKYLKFLIEGIQLGPQTSEWTNSKAELLRLLTRLWKVARWCLPNSQDSQPKEEIET